MTVTYKTNSTDIRIYFNKILHLRIPKDPKISLQSWFDEGKSLYVIELLSFDKQLIVEYEEYNIWQDVLKSLDKCI